MDKEKILYLGQLDSGIKFYRWKLRHFVISVCPLLLILIVRTLPSLIVAGVLTATGLLLTIELSPNITILSKLKGWIKYAMMKKTKTQQQNYSLQRLREIEYRLQFQEIKHDHIVLNSKKKGLLFEWTPYNWNLMNDNQKREILLNTSSFFSNYGDFKILIEEIAQNFKTQIYFNEGLNPQNKRLKELIKSRTDYFKSIEAGEVEEEKITLLYFETKEENIENESRYIINAGNSNDLELTLVKGDKLKRICAGMISNLKLIDVLPINSSEAISKEMYQGGQE